MFLRRFQYTKKDLNVAFSDLKQVRGNRFSSDAEAVVEKYWSSDGATVDFVLVPSNTEKALNLLDIHVGP